MKPVTGVTNLNESAGEWFWDCTNDGIEIAYEESRIDLMRQFVDEHQEDEEYVIDGEYQEDDLISDAEEHADKEMENWESDCMILVGDWKRTNPDAELLEYPTYEPDETGDWAGIYRRDSGNILQVVWSKWALQGAWCSPCYPNQVDLDSDGGIWGYCLPAAEVRDEWVAECFNQGRAITPTKDVEEMGWSE